MRKALVTAAVLLMAVGIAWAAGRPGVVRTKDGGFYDGSVEEKDDTVSVTVRGITTGIPRDRIESIVYGEFEARWTDAYAKLAADDIKGRLTAARRAFDERRYDLAEKACRDAQSIDPNNADAAELLKLTLSQRRLESSTPPPAGGTDSRDPGSSPTSMGKIPSPWKTLTPQEVNSIKQQELADTDAKVNFNFKNGVLKKYHDADPNTQMTFTQFSKLPTVQRAMMIIRNGGDLAKDVDVVNDPAVILSYKKEVQPLVLQGCATSACHGGNNESAKKFALITPAPSTPEAYTNFYVLQTYKKNVSEGVIDGVFNPAFATMIDRSHADMSLLLQYGLPEQSADYKHPRTRGYNGIFPRGKEDPKYLAIRSWITSLNRLPPDYGFKFTLERRDAVEATPPTTGPATGPSVQGAVDSVKNLLK